MTKVSAAWLLIGLAFCGIGANGIYAVNAAKPDPHGDMGAEFVGGLFYGCLFFPLALICFILAMWTFYSLSDDGDGAKAKDADGEEDRISGGGIKPP